MQHLGGGGQGYQMGVVGFQEHQATRGDDVTPTAPRRGEAWWQQAARENTVRVCARTDVL